MGIYLIKRIFLSIPIVLGVTVVTFFIINLIPGSPLDLMVDPSLSEEERKAMEHSFGLDAPLYQQYFIWINDLLHGNLGYSITSSRPVLEIISERIFPTLLLMGTSLLVGVGIAIPLGIVSAVCSNSLIDYLIRVLSFLGASIPNFFLGLGLIYIGSVQLQLFPSGGMETLGNGGGIFDVAKHMVLPCLVLSIAITGKFTRYVRASMLDVLSQDYIRTAVAKGGGVPRIILVHAFPNALLPIVTMIGLEIPTLLGGAVVTEQIFAWPGIGRLTMDSILVRDYPTLMGLNLLAAIMIIISNLITDIIYTIVDHRIKY